MLGEWKAERTHPEVKKQFSAFLGLEWGLKPILRLMRKYYMMRLV